MSQEIIQEFEQRRTYARGFPSTLWTRISHRLQLRMPDHFPSTPYPIDDVFDAATWVLRHGSSLSPSSSLAIASVSDASPLIVTPSTPALQPDIRSLFSKFTKSIVDAIASSTSDPSMRMTDCDFCGGEHFIRDCDAATEYIQLGKCKRNVDGKITLPYGAFVPRYIPGTLLRDRIDEWHRRNPAPVQSNLFHSISTASSAQASISATLTTTAATTTSTAAHTPTSAPTSSASPSTSTDRASQPAKEERIATLQAEILALRSKIPQTVQPGAFPFHRSIDIATLPTSTSSSDIDYNIASLFDPADTSDDTSARHLKGYEPPTTPTFGSKAPVSKKKAAPQQTKASTDRSLDCPITISTSQLLLTAPDIRKQYFDATKPATRPIADSSAATALLNADIDIETHPSDTAHIVIAPLVDMFYSSVVLSPSQHLQSPSSPVTVSSSIDIDFTSFDAETDVATAPDSGSAFSSPIQAPSSDFDKYQPLVSPEHRFDHRPSITQLPQSPQRFPSSCRHSITRRHRFKSLLRFFSSSHRRITPHRFSFRHQPSKPRRHRSTLRPRRFAPRLRSNRRHFALRRRLTPSPLRFTSQPVASFIEPPQNTPSTTLRPPVASTLQDRPPRARLRQPSTYRFDTATSIELRHRPTHRSFP
ncbi:hypothetical protein CPC08DRAFT_771350 [Agrocybe pediades]|nr:hypothetical protein CPC08DRAFT_771350 [Agrocybe pediades]